MDYGTFRGLYTLLLIAIMVGIIVWAYSKRRKTSFDEAANLVFADDEPSGADKKNAGAKP
ncbi:CcoQ/FixQ family Cbb3-type cytochrome c oxidase assembly chaperone [Aeromonas australiensis]|uniref:CcoQ/FixQ family Cbb3-type cytochrome c oxidase assembly chaperone n=1 Tax=Aeromonas australiensis TaxID=1114880 RepID=UPI000589D260|nr:CcoQ/FixQ family Cbb3-type cytochrome c oxidase assembly chaperone [Aeromonas australiensis]